MFVEVVSLCDLGKDTRQKSNLELCPEFNLKNSVPKQYNLTSLPPRIRGSARTVLERDRPSTIR
jgi:hypothetical protein